MNSSPLSSWEKHLTPESGETGMHKWSSTLLVVQTHEEALRCEALLFGPREEGLRVLALP